MRLIPTNLLLRFLIPSHFDESCCLFVDIDNIALHTLMLRIRINQEMTTYEFHRSDYEIIVYYQNSICRRYNDILPSTRDYISFC
jgi:hypothetical protein